MARKAAETFTLPDGRVVGWGLKTRRGILRVQFQGPDGTRLEISTGCTRRADAYTEAAKIVLRTYDPTVPVANPGKLSWAQAAAYIRATPDLSPESVRNYTLALAVIRKHYPTTKGPGEITPALAERWKREYLSGTYTKTPGGKEYRRSPVTCTTYLRTLRSLWSKHFKRSVAANPWREVDYPNEPRRKRVKMPADLTIAELLTYFKTRYPNWETPLLFVRVKMLAGCRTLDLCRVPSSDLTDTTLTLRHTKDRGVRQVPLPDDLAVKLHSLKGPAWLWERSLEESKTYRKSVKTASRAEYQPKTWAHTIAGIFREFSDSRVPGAERVRPHDLRARAITLVAKATGSVDATAEALGLDPQTARHYLDRSKAFDGQEVIRKLSDKLLPPE